MDIKLSIMILSVPRRVENGVFKDLFLECSRQAEGKPVEILAFVDNKKITIGEKREVLLQATHGQWVCYCDDDDGLDANFIDEILKAIDSGQNPDVIVFKQSAVLDGGNPFIVSFGIENKNEPTRKDEKGQWVDIKRLPFHMCVWKASIAKKHHVPFISYGEDWAWAEKMLTEVKTQYRIDKVLHYYRFDSNKTEAQAKEKK